MQVLLAAARMVHFAAAISLTGTLAFACLIAEPVFRRSGFDDANARKLRHRCGWLLWVSLILALISGAAWLASVASEMSGRGLGAALSQGIAAMVLTRTRFGVDWLLRLGLAGLLFFCLVARNIRRRKAAAVAEWLALGLAATTLASLAWAGHGAATPGMPGNLHLAGDIAHLLAAGLWLGTLPPLAVLLTITRRTSDAQWADVAHIATRRFSRLAVASVVVLLTGGLVNTWFLAGTVPALVGTEYGRLLLAKIALFIAMLVVAAVNMLRLTPRLANAAATARTSGQLGRNALVETALGMGVLAIVGVLGELPPGRHAEPGWPFPFRLDFAVLTAGPKIMLAVAALVFCLSAIGIVAVAAAGKYRHMAWFGAGVALSIIAGAVTSFPAVEPAYPTSFYAPAQPYDATSVAAGAVLYADNCAACHGAEGEGNGPAATGLPIRPANLTEPHLFAHSPGDLFWWVSHGIGDGAMPGFAAVMTPDQRWDVINFIRARAAGVLAQWVGPTITTDTAYPVPDFAFVTGGAQRTLSETLRKGPVLLLLFRRPAPVARLTQLAAAQPRFNSVGLQIVAVELGGSTGGPSEEGDLPSPVVAVSTAAKSALALFRTPADGKESELLLDHSGNVRARWAVAGPEGLPDTATLVAEAAAAARFAAAEAAHAGHSH